MAPFDRGGSELDLPLLLLQKADFVPRIRLGGLGGGRRVRVGKDPVGAQIVGRNQVRRFQDQGDGALAGLGRLGHGPEDARNRGAVHAKRLIRQAAAGEPDSDAALADRPKVVQTGQMGREAG